MDKSFDRLYLQCIADLADAVYAIRLARPKSGAADRLENKVNAHMRMYQWVKDGQNEKV